MVTSARTCPSPGVSISSASVTAGNSLATSGNPRTRLCQRPVVNPLPDPLPLARCAGSGNIEPPGRSRLPVSAFSTSTSQLATVPKSTVVVPIRPYTAARSAAANRWVRARIVAASTPHFPATASGVNGATSSRTPSSPVTCGARSPRSTRSAANSSCAIASSRNTSVPGVIGTCWSAAAAVRLRRGSTTTNAPPRARSALSRFGMSGAVQRLPLEV